MRAVYKYDVPIGDAVKVDMPTDAHVLHVALQDGYPRVWAKVTPGMPVRPRMFRWLATGQEFNYAGEYVGTIHTGMLVFHLFVDPA